MESIFERRDPTTKERIDSAARTIYALRHVPFHNLLHLARDDSEMDQEQRVQAIAMLGSVSAAVTVAQLFLEIPDYEEE